MAVIAIPETVQMQQLADRLLQLAHCDARALERGRRVAEESGEPLNVVLLQLGLVSERGLAETYAALLNLRLIEADRFPADEALFADRLSARFLRQAQAVPVAVEPSGDTGADTLVVAVVNPLDPFTASAIAAVTGLRVRLEVAIPVELDAALKRLYPEQEAPQVADIASSGDPVTEDTERLKDLASEAPVIRLVNQLITRAVETQASDIHIEPLEDQLRIRYRYDGHLHEADSPPPRLAAAVISRIKIMAKLDIAERRLPQDGRLKLAVRGKEVDFRVSTVPSLYGETVVLRVLDRSAVVFDFARLGLAPKLVHRFRAALDVPNGIILVTGPTGSGKTTTLYTGLQALNSSARKIVTIEDPIEYQLKGISQIQVHRQIGLTFATLLRSILRQDPDIIMVGEIRDGETAQIAVQAALTGHLVLATLHTNSAAAAIIRLRDMGVEDYLLSAVLRGILAQRLVRRLCASCRRPHPASSDVIRRFGLEPRCEQAAELYHPVGCLACRQTGYRGRTGIAEFLELSPEIQRLIIKQADHATIEHAATAAGMQTLLESGIEAALAGETAIEEVFRAVRGEG